MVAERHIPTEARPSALAAIRAAARGRGWEVDAERLVDGADPGPYAFVFAWGTGPRHDASPHVFVGGDVAWLQTLEIEEMASLLRQVVGRAPALALGRRSGRSWDFRVMTLAFGPLVPGGAA